MPSAEGGPRREPTRRVFFALWPEGTEQLHLERASRDGLQLLQQSLWPSREDPRPGSAPRLVPWCNFHLTLAFLGSIPVSRVAQVQSIAAEVSRESCRVAEPEESAATARTPEVHFEFDHIEYWRKAKVLCALTAEDSAPSMQSPASALAERLKSGLIAAGFAPDLKPFRAHVTLARKILPPTAAHRFSPGRKSSGPGNNGFAMPRVTWRFANFALIDSRTAPQGSSYSVLDRWPLCTQCTQMAGKNLHSRR